MQSTEQVSQNSSDGIYSVGVHLVQSRGSLRFFPVEVSLDTRGKRAHRHTTIDTKADCSFAELVAALKGVNADTFGGDSCELQESIGKNAIPLREYIPRDRDVGTSKPAIVTGFHVDFHKKSNRMYGKVAVLDKDGRTNFVTTVTKRHVATTSSATLAARFSAAYDEVQGTVGLGEEVNLVVKKHGKFVFFVLA